MLLQYSSLKNYAAVLYYQLPASGTFKITIITFLTQRSGTLMFPNFERPFLLFSFLIFRRLEPMDSLILHVEFTFLRPIFRSLGSKILYPTYLTRRGQLSCHPSQRFFELVYRHFTASVHTVHTFIEYIPIWGFQ